MKRAVIVLAIVIGMTAFSGCSAELQNDGNFQFGKSVPMSEREPVKAGVKAMQDWIAQNGNVHLKRFTVHVDDNINTLVSQYAYVSGDTDPLVTAQWLVSGGAITLGDQVYIYVGPEWADYPDWVKSSIAAHETFHVAQFGFLWDDWAHGGVESPAHPPDWITEGGADYAAARALDASGIHPYEEALAETTEQATSYTNSLESISSPGADHASGGAAPYAVGFLAMENLALSSGEGAMFDFWDLLGQSRSWEEAFQGAYHRLPGDFVKEFDASRGQDANIPTGGIAGLLVRKNGQPVAGAAIGACPLSSQQRQDCRSTWTADDGSFELALPEGEWLIQYRVATRDSIDTGSFERGGTRSPSVTVGATLIQGLRATVSDPF
ncbi:MAG: hypothetical protein AB7N24_15910 [Dehalococcoidia bacterium]